MFYTQANLMSTQVLTSKAESDVGELPSLSGESHRKYGKIQDGLESSISLEGKLKITRILTEIQHLSDVEKLLLYLRLPTGVVKEDQTRLTPPSCLPTSNRKEQAEAFTWIRSHLEEHGDVCMPKAEVYEEYKEYCDQHELRYLCNADFGKMMKQVFPDINTRRLGQRGQSKYFYGGLRKKTDHTPPSLPDLEVQSKTIEIDSNIINNEIFKSSCQLVCEWADKLLDGKFSGVQGIAEHLVTNMYVNTTSVAAFTLIAAMQENGGHNLKGTALFNSQSLETKPKETNLNLLLQQKLHKNKQLQKQKEKLKAMKDEVEQNPSNTLLPLDRKTPNTPSKKSSTPSRMSKTPKQMSTTPTAHPVESIQENTGVVNAPVFVQTVSVAEQVQNAAVTTMPSLSQPHGNSRAMCIDLTVGGESTEKRGPSANKSNEVAGKNSISENSELKRMLIAGKQAMMASSHQLVRVVDGEVSMIERKADENKAETPYTEMETDDDECRRHVRKIDFDSVLKDKGVLQESKLTPKDASPDKRSHTKTDESSYAEKITSDQLSKSTGHLNLKKMLENKNPAEMNLNKSMGFLEKSKNTLFVSQSNSLGRSAFVPFSQARKENTSTSHSTSSALILPTSFDSMSQSGNIMIAVPSSVAATPVEVRQSGHRQLENIIKLIPGKEQSQEKITFKSVSGSIDPQGVGSSWNHTKESVSIITCSSILSKTSSCDSITTSAAISSSQHSPNIQKQYIPIQPKPTPNTKTTPVKENKGDYHTNDKRPVAAILKEKRAREQAEALAKIQTNLGIPAVPIPSAGISFGGGTALTTPLSLTSVAGNTATPKEVVIIVNNQTGAPTKLVPMENLLSHSLLTVSAGENATVSSMPQQDPGLKRGNQTEMQKELSMETQSGHELESLRAGENKNVFSSVRNIGRTATPFSFDTDMSMISRGDKGLTPIPSDSEETMESSDGPSGDTGSQNRVEHCLWMETPAKIAKLNISANSPFRPESACSLGRDTPVRKNVDASLSRPESACSYGRETPSGARKRKSSDMHPRRDFKRLNSTGDDADDQQILCLSGVLSPETDNSIEGNPRRTQSCTFEIDREAKYRQPQKQAIASLDALQSPDITSLEREALIESFPNSLYAMRPQKSQKLQSASVGVNARNLRQSQQKLLKQKLQLDCRVKNYFTKEADQVTMVTTVAQGRSISTSAIAEIQQTLDQQVVKDSVIGNRKSNTGLQNEPSGLPNDVADFIFESLEKSSALRNSSAMSEPDIKELERRGQNLNMQEYQFDMKSAKGNMDQSNTAVTSPGGEMEIVPCKKTSTVETNMNPFTVPKVPRAKDHLTSRGNQEATVNPQRCQSLPTFTSPNQSPLSPVTQAGMRGNMNFQRASSMSPRAHQGDIPSPVSGISPVRRVEVRDNHPISVSIHPVAKSGKPGMGEDRKTSYLASIQHNLQKPKEMMGQQKSLFREQTLEKISITQNQVIMPVNREPSIDRAVSITPDQCLARFSDSGYHSTGPSPVLNSTPVSGIDNDVFLQQGSGRQKVTESPITLTTEYNSQVVPVAPQQQIPDQKMVMGPPQNPKLSARIRCDSGIHTSPLNSSMNSAFIPINSHKDVRYVTPIKPTVTLPYTGSSTTGNIVSSSTAYETGNFDFTTNVNSGEARDANLSDNLFVDLNEGTMNTDVMMISPKLSQEPPSYETAMKSLGRMDQKLDQPQTELDSGSFSAIPPGSDGSFLGGYQEQTKMSFQTSVQQENVNPEDKTEQRVSLLANMGNQTNAKQPHSLGPFANKLMQLSRQTKISPGGTGSGNLLSALESSEEESSALKKSQISYIPSGTVPRNLNEIQQAAANQVHIGFSSNSRPCVSNLKTVKSESGKQNNTNFIQSEGAILNNIPSSSISSSLVSSAESKDHLLSHKSPSLNILSFPSSEIDKMPVTSNLLSSFTNHVAMGDSISMSLSNLGTANDGGGISREEMNLDIESFDKMLEKSNEHLVMNVVSVDKMKGIMSDGGQTGNGEDINIPWDTLEGPYFFDTPGLFGSEDTDSQQLGDFDINFGS